MQKVQRAFVYGMAFALIVAEASAAIGQATPAGTPAAPEPPGLTTVVPRLPPTNPPGSLASALLQAKPPAGQIAIAIGADRVRPPDGVAPPAGSTVYRLADLFGMLARPFGGVIAIAPSTMTVLNTAPDHPNLFEGMPAPDAFKMLVGSLTPTQWQALTSAQGIGMGDLQSADQRELFRSLFAGGLSAYAPGMPGNAAHPTPAKKIAPADLEQGRLRLSRHAAIQLSSADNHGFIGLQDSDQPFGVPSYIATGAGGLPGAVNSISGVPVRKETPNEPKTGNLDFHAAALQTPVSLTGINTVGQLIARIDHVTRVEIVADRRYESRSVTFVAGARAARAADLLQALAFCLTGTYRLVRPAFVLTDDLVGLGTRRVTLAEFRRAAERERSRDLEQVSDSILQAHPVPDLPPQTGSISLTAGQMQQALKQQDAMMAGMGPTIDLPMDQLTPEQRLAAQRIADGIDQRNEELSKLPQFQGQSFPAAALNGPVHFSVRPTVDLLLPSYDGPVSVDTVLSSLRIYMPSAKLRNERQQRKDQNAPIMPRSAPPPSLVDALRPFARRALLVDARTTQDLESIVVSMQKLGLNELWLEVFAPGIPEKSGPSALDGGDLMTEALKAAHGTGIHVLPVLRLLEWGQSAPDSLRDLTILGEESPAAQERLVRDNTESGTNLPVSSTPTEADVSPFDSNVQKKLEQVVSSVAAQPGIAGMVWREVTPPGYSVEDYKNAYAYREELGYSTAGRFAFLLSKHADPLDIDPILGREMETALPEIDNAAIEDTLRSEWRRFRVDEDLDLLRNLRQIVAKASPAAVLVEAHQSDDGVSRGNGWYGNWEGGISPLPALHGGGAGSIEMASQAHAESRTAIFCLMPQTLWSAGNVASVLESTTNRVKWDGVVLDLTAPHTAPGRAPTSAERLAALTK